MNLLFAFFQDIEEMEEKPPTPPTPVKVPEEQDKASKTQAEREPEDQLSDTKAAIMKEVGVSFSICRSFPLADGLMVEHYLHLFTHF